MFFYADAFCPNLDLSLNTNLTSMTFRHVHFHDYRHKGPCISRILDGLTSTHITMVGIGVTGLYQMDAPYFDPQRLEVIEWDIIERILGRPNYSGLQKIVIFGAWPPE